MARQARVVKQAYASPSLQRFEVGGHFISGLGADDKRDEELADAATFEVDRDGQAGPVLCERFDRDVNDGPYRSVDAAYAPGPRAGRRG